MQKVIVRRIIVPGIALAVAAAAALSCSSSSSDNAAPTGPTSADSGATQLTISRQPSATSQSGVAFAQQPIVQLLDDSDKVAHVAGLVVTASIASGGGSLGGTTEATTSASGAATFTDLSVIGSAGARVLSFSAAGVTSVNSGSINVTSGGATKLLITSQPSGTIQSGIPFPAQPVIQLQNAANASVTQAGIVIAATIDDGSGTLGGTTTATTNANGSAAFTNLVITGTDGPRGLSFSTPGLDPPLTGATSAIMTLIGGVPAALSLLVPPSANATSGVAFDQQPIVQLLDAQNNDAKQSGVTVTVTIASGGGTLGGAISATTDDNGIATFSNLSISGSTGARTLSFGANGLTAVTSGTITVSTSGGPPR